MALSEEDKKEIADIIKATVNGKIDALSRKVEPITDIFETWSHLKAQAMFWIGGLLALGGAIQALQALWGLISPHLKP